MKLPPFGRDLAIRLRYGNVPPLVHVLAGPDAWDIARSDAVRFGGCQALVWDGDDYRWPLEGCIVRFQVSSGPSVESCIRQARMMCDGGALAVCIWFLFDYDDPGCVQELLGEFGNVHPLVVRSDGIHQPSLDEIRGPRCGT
jgi:hypothetical protein